MREFRNSTPAFPNNSWQGVELFLQTWAFLPNEAEDKLMKLDKKDLVKICNYALDASARIELGDKDIKFIQEKLKELGWLNEK